MSKIFITGSTDGLGNLAAKALLEKGHQIVLHARNEQRAEDVKKEIPNPEAIVIGDLASAEETKSMAEKVNTFGDFDAIIHNAGVLRAPDREVFNVNTLAPYILTCLIRKPQRLIYLSSGMHKQGHFRLEDLTPELGRISYSDTKLQVLLLTKAVARKWPTVYANAVDPGWVPTKMGGRGAPDNLRKGYETQVWLAVSDDDKAKVSGHYFHHKKKANYHPDADDIDLQESFINRCAQISGVRFPVDRGAE